MKFILNKKIIILVASILFVLLFSKIVFADWDGDPYNPGETLDPECSPLDPNCDVIPALTAAITSLNGLTSASQTFAIGTDGTAPAFSSTTTVHTLNIPMASTTSVTAGLLSKTDYDIFNAKVSSQWTTTGSDIYYSGGNVGIGNTNPGELFALGQAGVTKGVFSLAGNTSGKLTIQPSADAGDYTLTLPGTAGTDGYFLKTNGSGVLSWADLTYTNTNPMPNTVGGLTAGSTFSTQTIQNMFDRLLYPYVAPAITLAAVPVTSTVREFGNTVSSVTLNATTTKRSNNITLVEFYRSGSLIHSQASPLPGGGLETYIDTTPVTTNSITFTAKVGDGTQTTTSSGIAYTFVYPFYYGVGAQDLTGAQIRSNLTLLVKTPSNTTYISSPSNQVFYLAYPNTSSALTSILDTNGFETISDYTFRAVSITGLDGTSVTYKVYEYKNPTTQTNFTNQFKF